MSTTLQRIDAPGDADLIAAVRGGDRDAYGLLFERHVEAARRLARQLVPGPDAEDLVSEAFAKVMVVLQRGGGPDLAFRAYLLTAVRRLHVDRVRAAARSQPTDDLEPFDPGVPFRDTAVEGFESAAAARAFASLPERWQLVLWHTEVEGHKPAEVAPLLGISANSVSALAYRAREGLRQAFLAMHAQEAEDDRCVWTRQNLGAYIRGGLSRRDTGKVEEHLGGCRPCTGIYLELMEVNSDLAALLGPALLGGAATAYVSSGSAGSAVGSLVLLDRAKDVVAGHGAATAVAGAATVAVVAGAVVVGLPFGGDPTESARKGTAAAAGTSPSSAPPVAEPQRTRRAADGVLRREQRTRAGAVPPGQGATGQAGTDATGQAGQPGQSGQTGDAGPTGQLDPAGQDDPTQQPDQQQPGTTTPTSPGQSDEPQEPDSPNPPTEEPTLTYDLEVSATKSQKGKGLTRVTVTVSGLPAGYSTTLTAQGNDVVAFRPESPGCTPAGGGYACSVTGDGATYTFSANGPEGKADGSITFAVALLGDGTDTSSANNSTTVAIE